MKETYISSRLDRLPSSGGSDPEKLFDPTALQKHIEKVHVEKNPSC